MNGNIFAENKRGEPQNSTGAVARRILSADGNTVKLSIVTLLCILVGMLVLITSSWLGTVLASGVLADMPIAVALVSTLSLTVLFGGAIFLFLPCITGAVIFARRTVDGEKPKFAALLEPFAVKNKKKYISSILLPIAILTRAFIIFLPFVGSILTARLFVSDFSGMSLGGIVARSAFVFCLSAVALAVGMYLSTYFFFVPYLLVEERAGFIAAFSMSAIYQNQRLLNRNKFTI